MREETRLIYRCDFCNKISLQKSSMLKHEKACKQNPDIILMCRNCVFREFLKEEFEYKERITEEIGRQCHISFTFHYCEKRNIKMIPPKVFRNEFLNGALKDKYDQIMPTVNNGCLDYEEAKQ